MGKLIHITESQLLEIVGNGAYLNSQDTTNEYRFGGAEITANGVTGNYVDGDVEMGEPVTTDKIARQMARHRVRGMGRTVLPESNQDLTGKNNTFQLSNTEMDKLKQRVQTYAGSHNDAGIKRSKNLMKKGRISYDDAYRVLDDMNKGNAGSVLDPDGTLRREIENKIKTGTDISKNDRQSKINRGENVLKSTNKTGMKGGTHTPKGNNIIGVTYEN
jgi:polyhydroxyalkanoate synthesis regulator phasin